MEDPNLVSCPSPLLWEESGVEVAGSPWPLYLTQVLPPPPRFLVSTKTMALKQEQIIFTDLKVSTVLLKLQIIN